MAEDEAVEAKTAEAKPGGQNVQMPGDAHSSQRRKTASEWSSSLDKSVDTTMLPRTKRCEAEHDRTSHWPLKPTDTNKQTNSRSAPYHINSTPLSFASNAHPRGRQGGRRGREGDQLGAKDKMVASPQRKQSPLEYCLYRVNYMIRWIIMSLLPSSLACLQTAG